MKVLRFDEGGSLTPLAVVMHAVCHPCFFTWGDKGTPPYPNGYPKMSADFPGEAQTFVETCYRDKTSALFLQGCAGESGRTCRAFRIGAPTRPTSSGRAASWGAPWRGRWPKA